MTTTNDGNAFLFLLLLIVGIIVVIRLIPLLLKALHWIIRVVLIGAIIVFGVLALFGENPEESRSVLLFFIVVFGCYWIVSSFFRWLFSALFTKSSQEESEDLEEAEESSGHNFAFFKKAFHLVQTAMDLLSFLRFFH